MYHDDDDLHMCINCHATIVGLENYITHRNAGPCKQQTPVKENEAPISVLPPLGMPKSEHIRSMPSASTPSSGDHLNFLNADFFFSSLELQSRRKDAVFEDVMGIEEVLEEEFEEREGQGMVHVSGGKWGYEDYVQERDVWGGIEEKGREIGELERGDMDGGCIVSKGEGKKEGGKNVDLGEERGIGGKRRLRATSEMEENNSEFMEGLGSGSDFTIGGTPSKCGHPPRESMLATTQSQELDIHGTSEAGSCSVNDFSISLDSCGMEIGNRSHKEDDARYEGTSAAPPRGHTRGKWVPGLATEGMRKSGNAVEYFCRPCNKNIRNRRSYETHLSTLCHLKKLMSSSNHGITTAPTEGLRLRSRRLQVTKSKSTSSTLSNVNKCSIQENENDFSRTGDHNSQNYLMESLGIKRKVAVADSKESGSGIMKAGEAIDGQPPKNFSSSSNDAVKGRNNSAENSNAKKNLKHKTKRKVKHKKGISKIQKVCGQHVTAQKVDRRSISNSLSLDVPAPVSTPNVCKVKMARKSSGDCSSFNGVGESVKESKSVLVEEKASVPVEDKFLPISDPHISHGYFYDSLEIQEKQKKIKENIDLVRQRCDSSLLSSAENLQDQMMLGLELMRTEHLLSSSDKLLSKGESLSKGANSESREEVMSKGSPDSCVDANLMPNSNAHRRDNCNEVKIENLPEIRKENFDEQLENIVHNEICGSNTNNKLVFDRDKLPFTSLPHHDKRSAFEGNAISTIGSDSDIIKDRLSQQSEGRSNSFFNSSMISSQSVDIIESMKESDEMPKESSLSKCLVSLNTNSGDILCDDGRVLSSPKKILTLKLVKKGNHVMNICKRFSCDQVHDLISFTCDDKISKVHSKVVDNSGKKSEVKQDLPRSPHNSGSSSALAEDVSTCSKEFSCTMKHLPSLTKNSTKILVVKKGLSQVKLLSRDNCCLSRGQILVFNKSKSSLQDSFTMKRCQGESIKEESPCGSLKKIKLHLQNPQPLICKIINSETNQREAKTVSVKKESVLSISNITKYCDQHATLDEIAIQKNSKYSTENEKQPSEQNEATTTQNLHSGTDSDVINSLSMDTSVAAENMSKNIDQFHCENLRSTAEENKREQTNCEINQFCNRTFDRDDVYPIASEDLIEHEEVVESSQTCSVTCPTVSVVINVKSTFSDPGNLSKNLITNDSVKCDVSHDNFIKSDSNQQSSHLLEDLLLKKPSIVPMKLGEKSLGCNSRDNKCMKRDTREQTLVQKSSNISDNVEEKSTSSSMLGGADIVRILTSGTVSTQQNKEEKTVLYCCRLCKYKSSRHWCVERHTKKHFPRNRSFSCNKCSLSFLTMDNLKQHLKRHKKKRWCCSIQNCKQAFSTKQELLAHVSGPHVAEKPFKCEICDYSGKNQAALIRHRKLHEEQATVKCESCSHVCKKGSLSRHMKMHNLNDLFHCPFCDFTSYYLTSIHRHVTQSELHPNKMLYNCPFCPVAEGDVEKNEEMEHTYCISGSSFSTNNAHEIMDHINSAHKVEKSYSYLYSNITEIIRKIHKLLGIIRPSDI